MLVVIIVSTFEESEEYITIDKERLKTTKIFVGSRSPQGAPRLFAAITGSNFRKESYPPWRGCSGHYFTVDLLFE